MVVSGLEGGEGVEGLEGDGVLGGRVSESGVVGLKSLGLDIEGGLDTGKEAVTAEIAHKRVRSATFRRWYDQIRLTQQRHRR